MNRRNFLKAIAAVPVAAVLAPLAIDDRVRVVVRRTPILPPGPSTFETLYINPNSAFARALKIELDAMTREFKADLNRQLFTPAKSPGHLEAS